MHQLVGWLRRCVRQLCSSEHLHRSALGRLWLECVERGHDTRGIATRRALACDDEAARRRLEAAIQIAEARPLAHPFAGPSMRGAGTPSREFVMVRRTYPTAATAMSLCLLGLGAPVAAQDLSSPSLRVAAEAAAAQITIARQPAAPLASPSRERRPASLVPLYLSLSALQALDVHSTLGAIDRGAVEANPLMKGLAGNGIGLLAIKAAGTTGVVYASERIWRRSKTKAVIFMVATNAGMAWVVYHNYRAAH